MGDAVAYLHYDSRKCQRFSFLRIVPLVYDGILALIQRPSPALRSVDQNSDSVVRDTRFRVLDD